MLPGLFHRRVSVSGGERQDSNLRPARPQVSPVPCHCMGCCAATKRARDGEAGESLD